MGMKNSKRVGKAGPPSKLSTKAASNLLVVSSPGRAPAAPELPSLTPGVLPSWVVHTPRARAEKPSGEKPSASKPAQSAGPLAAVQLPQMGSLVQPGTPMMRQLLIPSSVPGVVLPGIPSAFAAQIGALLLQLGTTETLPANQLRALQMIQLNALLKHAWENAPFWKSRLRDAGWTPSMAVDPGLLLRLPLLTRAEVQKHGSTLRSQCVPEGFGPESLYRTSGSTGRPVEVYRNALNERIYDAQTFRDHLWHGRNTRGKLAVLRTRRQDGVEPEWGRVSREMTIGGTGPAVIRGSDGKDFRSHLDWLAAERPDYLNINPTLAAALTRLHLSEGYPRLAIHQILSTGGTVTDEARTLCREAWGAEFTDRYSCEEIGYLAFQCPKHTHYHTAETVIIEILNSAGRPCSPGQTGRVVVTSLLSFAMPLLRYDLGDMAVPGDACDCGRGLPTISRIIGREFNFAVLPSGHWRVGMLQAKDWADAVPVRDFRVKQTALDRLEVELVLPRPMTENDVTRAKTMLREFFGYDFVIAVKQVKSIDWGRTDKRENFVRLPGVGNDIPF